MKGFWIAWLLLLIGCNADAAFSPEDIDGGGDDSLDLSFDDISPFDFAWLDENEVDLPDGSPDSTTGDAALNELPFQPAGPGMAPDPMQSGPFPVGVVTYDLYDESRIDPLSFDARFLRTEVWYPAVQSARNGTFWAYDFKEEADEKIDLGLQYETFMKADLNVLPSGAVRAVEIDRRYGPYPVILLSHGAYSLRFYYVFYAVHLASHGYIVVAPDHAGNTTWDALREGFNFISLFESGADRLSDMSFLLDQLEEMNRTAGHFLYAMLDLAQVGITGHSYGGFVAAAYPVLDSRISASVMLAPAVDMCFLHNCQFGDYPVPAMIMGGTDDHTIPWKRQYCSYRQMTGPTKYLYELLKGGHFTFSDMCVFNMAVFNLDGAPNMDSDGCSATDFVSYVVAHQSINHYAAAFFNIYLRDSQESVDFLKEYADPPFTPVNFYIGDVPDWSDGGC